MKLVVEIIPHGNEKNKTYRTITKFPVALGRGFNNDIIITDPYVCEQHAVINHAENNWVIKDSNSLNGIYINEEKRSGIINSGDTIKLGQTEIRIYAVDFPVSKSLKIHDARLIFLWLAKPLNTWIAFFSSMLLLQVWAYLEIWSEERTLTAATSAAVGFGIIIVWTTLWSAASRLIINKSNFLIHMAVISTYFIISIFLWYIEVYANFLANENWLANAVNYSINFSVLSMLIYYSLHFSSHMTEKKKRASALFFSLGVITGVFLLGLASQKSFNDKPLYPTTLEPFLSWLTPTDTLEDFQNKNIKLFNAKEFKNNST